MVRPWKLDVKLTMPVAGVSAPAASALTRASFRANLSAASFASVPLLQ